LIASALLSVATILIILGLFSSQNYAEYQRRRELGLLIALGAPRRRIFLNVIAAGLRLTFVGSLAGTLIAFGLLRSLEGGTEVIGVRSLWVWLTGPLISAVVILLTSSIPAYRSSRLDPRMVMHGEHSNRP
jgi:putative ABC transport system permease protein